MESTTPNRDDLTLRWFAGWICFVIGFVLGLAIVELAWRHYHPHGIGHFRPVRGWDYYLLSAASSIAGGVAGLGIARLRDLPAEDDPRISGPPA